MSFGLFSFCFCYFLLLLLNATVVSVATTAAAAVVTTVSAAAAAFAATVPFSVAASAAVVTSDLLLAFSAKIFSRSLSLFQVSSPLSAVLISRLPNHRRLVSSTTALLSFGCLRAAEDSLASFHRNLLSPLAEEAERLGIDPGLPRHGLLGRRLPSPRASCLRGGVAPRRSLMPICLVQQWGVQDVGLGHRGGHLSREVKIGTQNY